MIPPLRAPGPPLPRMTGAAGGPALVIAALCALAAVTSTLYDPDLWQHLLVGKVIWATHSIPHTQLWTWPTHGAPDVLPSWLFRALLWPFWQLGGMTGLFVWRWLTTLAMLGLMLVTVRRMGATGAAPVVMLVWCALFWRQRSQVRPETLAAILLAAQMLLLETRRRMGPSAPPRLAWGLVPIALLWANAHISYYLGFLIAAGYLADDLVHARERRDTRTLGLAVLAAALASLVNPFGAAALAQPFEYFLYWRHEPIYASIGELSPVDWSVHVRDALPVWLALVAFAAVARFRRHGLDAAQAVVYLYFVPQALTSQRFLGYAAVAVTPFAARDVGVLLSRVRWPAGLAAPGRRAALSSLAAAALTLPTLLTPGTGFGFGYVGGVMPERACDWMARHGVRGRGFNTFHFGGYLLWRFYPEADRLPFMDIHQAGTKAIRYLYAFALQDTTAWNETQRRYPFDWALLPSHLPHDPNLLDQLDADRARWSLVFTDDAATLWLRRGGALDSLANTERYAVLPAGDRALVALGDRAASDSTLREAVRREARRAMESSPWNARAHVVTGSVELQEGRFEQAVREFELAARVKPWEPGIHERLGISEYYAGRPERALAAYERERVNLPGWAGYDFRRGAALAALGRHAEAREAYLRSLARHPEITEARDSLASPMLR